MMINLNFNESDKAIVTGAENHRGYVYYDFTEGKARAIAAKDAKAVEYNEWCSLLQMLYPTSLICSGLFDPFLVFEIVDRRRKDPPKFCWPSLNHPGSDGSILLDRFIATLKDHGIEVDESWHEIIQKEK